MIYKYNQFKTEALTIKNSSELGDTWSPSKILVRDKDKQLTGEKYLDLKLGQKVIDLFSKYNLSIDVIEGDYLKTQRLILWNEKKFKEYRVSVSKKGTFEEYIEWEYSIDYNEYIADKTEVEIEELQEEYDDWGGFDRNENISWSVFLPPNTKGHKLTTSAMSDSSTYLKILSNGYEYILKGGMLDYTNALNEYMDGFKNYINKKEIKITNKNIEIVPDITRRIYKDSKVFYEFKELFDSYDINIDEFFSEWLKLM